MALDEASEVEHDAAGVVPEPENGLGMQLGDVGLQFVATDALEDQPSMLAHPLVGLASPHRPDAVQHSVRSDDIPRAQQGRGATRMLLGFADVRSGGQCVAPRRAHQR